MQPASRQPLILIIAVFWAALHITTNAQTATLQNLELSAKEIAAWCPVSDRPDTLCPKQGTRVNVTTTVKNPNGESLVYNYIVSGGEIVGRGPTVVWNLLDAQPGHHSITVGLGANGIIRGKTITKSLSVYECPVCDLPCECSSIAILGPREAIEAGDAFIVRAELRGGEDKEYRKLKWTVSEGSVVEGQGTTEVLVRTNSEIKAKTIKVTLRILTACSETCPNDITEEFSVNPKKLH